MIGLKTHWRQYRVSILFMLLLCAVVSQSHATIPGLIDTHTQDKSPLRENIHIYQGPETTLDELIEKLHFFSLWKLIDPDMATWKEFTQPVKLMFNITNSGDTAKHMMLVHPRSTLNNIRMLQIVNGSVVEQYNAGSKQPFFSRPIAHRYFLFPIDIEPGQNVTVLIETDGLLDDFFREFYLTDRQTFFERTDTDLILTSLYLGILLLFVIYSWMLYALTRENSSLIFSLFVFALLIRTMTVNNYLFEFVWPNMPMMQNLVLVTSIMMGSGLLGWFAMTYLSITNKKRPILFKIYCAYIAGSVLMIIIQAFKGWSVSDLGLWIAIAAPFTFIVWATTLWDAKKGSKNAQAFLVAFTILIVGEVMATGYQLLDLNMPLNTRSDLAQLTFIVIFSIILSRRIGKSREKVHIAYAKNKAKSDFLAKMSHEIRTPINGVLGMAQLLSETPLSRKQQHYADVINHCSKTLLNVINDILEYSKIEAGKLECESTPFNIDDLLLNNSALFWSQIKNKQLEYKLQIDPRIPHNLIGDPARLQQIFNNLFSNSIKFTDTGHVKLKVSLLNINQSTARIEFQIKDTGIGMSEEELGRIFTPFSQARASTNRKYGGSGLGLSITKQLVELMGGKIAVHSEIRVGTSFSLEIPFEVDSFAEYKRQEHLAQFAGRRVLVLSDAVSGRDLIRASMQAWQMKTQHFTNVDEIVEFMEAGQDKDYDIFCLSASLLAGVHYNEREMLQKVASKTLIYDQAFRQSPEYVRGFDGAHFLKAPFSLRQVQEHVAEILGLAEIEVATKLESTLFKPRSELKVLVAEDDATNRLVIRAILKKLLVEHDIVDNGTLVAERYKEASSEYDMILMDCEMPEMNGYDASIAIREFEKENKKDAIPIIALTAHVLPEYEKRCYDSGMNLVIGKPINLEELTTAFDQYCRDPESLRKSSLDRK